MTWFLFCYWYEPDAPKDPVGLVRIWKLAQHLGRAGEQVTVFPPRYASSQGHREFRTISIPLIARSFLRPLSYVIGSFLAGLRAGCAKRPIVVYYRWMASPHPLLLARLLRSVCVCEINGEPVPEWHGSARGLLDSFRDWLARHTLRRCDRVVVLTEGLRDMVIQRYQTKPERVIVLPSGTDTDLYQPQDRQVCRQRLGLDSESQYIGFVGTFFQYQGLDRLLDAFAVIRNQKPTVRLLLVGDGETADALKQQAKRLGLVHAITFTGRVPYGQVPDFIASMNVCVAPFTADRGETSPVKLFDYLACGRPAIASAIPSVSGLFSETRGVKLVPPDDTGSLAATLLHILESPEEAEELGRRGRQFVEKQYNWTHLALALKEWLKKEPAHAAQANPSLL